MHIFAVIMMGLSVTAVLIVADWIYGENMDETDMEETDNEQD